MHQVSVYAPGVFAEVSLPCVPDVDQNGVITLIFSVGRLPVRFLYSTLFIDVILLSRLVDCYKASLTAQKAYFEFSILVLRY